MIPIDNSYHCVANTYTKLSGVKQKKNHFFAQLNISVPQDLESKGLCWPWDAIPPYKDRNVGRLSFLHVTVITK